MGNQKWGIVINIMIVFLLVIISSACSMKNTHNFPKITQTSEVKKTASIVSIIPENDPVPTIAVISVTDAPTPTSSKLPTVTPTEQTDPVCPKVHSTLSKGFLKTGVIVYSELKNNRVPGDLYRFSVSGNISQILPLPIPCCALPLYIEKQVSPDHRWLGLQYSTPESNRFDKVILVNSNEKLNKVISLRPNWGSNFVWVNSEQMLFYSLHDLNSYATLLNPFQNQETIFELNLPHLQEKYFSGDWLPIFDPSLSRAIYLYNTQAIPSIGGERAIVLWDLVNKKELWRRELPEKQQLLEKYSPIWTTDGQRFVIMTLEKGSTNRFELLTVTREGIETKLNHKDIPDPIKDAGGFSLSPDNRYLSFFVLKEGYEHLLIYDFTTQEVWDPCFTEAPNVIYQRPAIVWSPDSQQFIINILKEGSDSDYAYFWAVDIAKREISPLGFRFWNAIWLQETNQ